MSEGVSIWIGRAKRKEGKMRPAVYELMLLLKFLSLLPDDMDDDWPEMVRCYVDRMLRLGI